MVRGARLYYSEIFDDNERDKINFQNLLEVKNNMYRKLAELNVVCDRDPDIKRAAHEEAKETFELLNKIDQAVFKYLDKSKFTGDSSKPHHLLF